MSGNVRLALMTGIGGFVGRHLAAELLAWIGPEGERFRVVGCFRPGGDAGNHRTESQIRGEIQHAFRELCAWRERRSGRSTAAPDLGDRLVLEPLDITARKAFERWIVEHSPDEIYHLAAVSSEKEARDAVLPDRVSEPALETRTSKAHVSSRLQAVNVESVATLLDAVRSLKAPCSVLFVSSCLAYDVDGRDPSLLDELTEILPTADWAPATGLGASPYGSSKAKAEELIRERFGADASSGSEDDASHRVVIARPFHHTGSGQLPKIVLGEWAQKLIKLERARLTSPTTFATGDTSQVRDYSHVREVAAAYRVLARSGTSGEAYNVCSGQAHSLRSILDRMIAKCGLTAVLQPEQRRKTGASPAPPLAGDNGRLRRLVQAHLDAGREAPAVATAIAAEFEWLHDARAAEALLDEALDELLEYHRARPPESGD